MQAFTLVPDSLSATSSIKLYFSPMACSLASRIAAYEGDLPVEYVEVSVKDKRMRTDGDYFAINPMGQVPVLELDGGVRLSENTAVLQYLADRAPDGLLAPAGGFARARLQQWLGFINTELHKGVFQPLLNNAASAVQDAARQKIALRLDFLEKHLADHAFLLDRFSVADAYLTTVLCWAPHGRVDLGAWPATQAYVRRMVERPKVAAAIAHEFALWKAEQKRMAA